MKPIVETSRLLLREVILDDAEGFFEMDSNPNVARYVGGVPVESIDQCREVIRSLQKQYLEFGIGRWAVLSKDSGEFLGWCGLKRMAGYQMNGHSNHVDIGYRFSEKHWGKGFASEAAQATLDYGFTQLKFEKICAFADLRNLASQHVLAKIGLLRGDEFEFEGLRCVWFEKSRE